MGQKAILIQVTVFDEETGAAELTVVKTYEGSYGYEVRRMFERLGEKFSRLIDPSDDF